MLLVGSGGPAPQLLSRSGQNDPPPLQPDVHSSWSGLRRQAQQQRPAQRAACTTRVAGGAASACMCCSEHPCLSIDAAGGHQQRCSAGPAASAGHATHCVCCATAAPPPTSRRPRRPPPPAARPGRLPLQPPAHVARPRMHTRRLGRVQCTAVGRVLARQHDATAHLNDDVVELQPPLRVMHDRVDGCERRRLLQRAAEALGCCCSCGHTSKASKQASAASRLCGWTCGGAGTASTGGTASACAACTPALSCRSRTPVSSSTSRTAHAAMLSPARMQWRSSMDAHLGVSHGRCLASC